MKFQDLTIRQIVNLCKSRPTCEGCPLSHEEIYSHTRYLECWAKGLFAYGTPRDRSEYVLNQDIEGVSESDPAHAAGAVHCADCTHAEIYGERVSCRRAPGAAFTVNSFCSEGVTRNEVG